MEQDDDEVVIRPDSHQNALNIQTKEGALQFDMFNLPGLNTAQPRDEQEDEQEDDQASQESSSERQITTANFVPEKILVEEEQTSIDIDTVNIGDTDPLLEKFKDIQRIAKKQKRNF